MYAIYDLQGNIITICENLKELAKYFDTSYSCIKSIICKERKGILKKKRDKRLKRWCYIEFIEEDDGDE